MSQLTIERIQEAMTRAAQIRPKVGGFPYLAECLRQAGVIKNVWQLPSAQARFYTEDDLVVVQNPPLVEGFSDVPAWDEIAFLEALRADQAGETTFPDWLRMTWESGCIAYEVDLLTRTCTYYGSKGETYVEEYPAVEIDKNLIRSE